MEGYCQFWAEGDAIGRAVALLLLADVGVRLGGDPLEGLGAAAGAARSGPRRAAFWSCPDLTGRSRLRSLDREQVLSPLLDAALSTPTAGTLEASGETGSQLTRRLRDALHRVWRTCSTARCCWHRSAAPLRSFGLFGTVWGIYHALLGISAAGSIRSTRWPARWARR
jgi:biopolymer transport protein ExbB